MDNIYDFNESIKVGSSGEQIVINWLCTLPTVLSVEDVSAQPFYQDRDIDFIVHTTQGQDLTIELKSDTYTTGNLAYETLSSIEVNSLGCMRKSQAQYLFYYFLKWDKLYIFKFDEFRNWCESHLTNYRRVEVANYRRDGSLYHSENWLIKLNDLENQTCLDKIIYNIS